MRHLHSLNENKYVVTIISGCHEQIRQTALDAIAMELFMEKMHHVAELSVEGSVPCLTCGVGDDCKNSGLPFLSQKLGKKIEASTDYCVPVESQLVWEKGTQIGQLLGQFINGEIEPLPCIKREI